MRLDSCFTLAGKQCIFHLTPCSTQTALKTVALATFTALATAHYDSKEYIELTAVHEDLLKTHCWHSE